MKAVILAGGLGTRLAEETDVRPKPMVEIGGKPILWHIMKIYARSRLQRLRGLPGLQGLRHQGVLRELLPAHVATSRSTSPANAMEVHHTRAEPWRVTLVDTGRGDDDRRPPQARAATTSATSRSASPTATASPTSTSRRCVAFHRAHGTLATVTAVQPPGRFGALDVSTATRVTEFAEKPRGRRRWINGGFFVLEPRGRSTTSTATRRSGSASRSSASPRDGELLAYRHEGFWQPMDTLRDRNVAGAAVGRRAARRGRRVA